MGAAGRSSSRNSAILPTLDQRFRVLELLSTLSPHHTKECLKHAQPMSVQIESASARRGGRRVRADPRSSFFLWFCRYVEQAQNRYTPLYGAKASWRRVGGLFSWGSKHKALANDHGGLDLDDSHQGNVRRDLSSSKHQYFFAINLYNSFDVIPDIFATLFRVAAILGYSNVYVSIYENGSTDQTKALLRIFDALAQVAGLRVEIRTSMRTRGAFNHRIEYLAEVRNAALVPLHELRENKQIVFDSIVFMNDILPCVDDLLELIWQSRRQNAGITCASDYMFHDDIVSLRSRRRGDA